MDGVDLVWLNFIAADDLVVALLIVPGRIVASDVDPVSDPDPLDSPSNPDTL